jgi:DNA-binding NtrC family response regulator
LLTAFDWPGNIRQLENTIFRAIVLAQGHQLNIDDFTQIAAQIPGYITENGESIFSGSRDVMPVPSLSMTDMPRRLSPISAGPSRKSGKRRGRNLRPQHRTIQPTARSPALALTVGSARSRRLRKS